MRGKGVTVLIKLMRQYAKPYQGALLIVIVLQLIQTIASLYLPTMNADIIDNGVSVGNTGYILRMGSFMLLVSLGQVTCAVVAVYFSARAAMGFGRDLRAGIFTHIQGFSAEEVAKFGAPSLITRSTNDIQQIQMVLLMSLTIMVTAPIMLVGGVIMALQQDVKLSLILVVVVPILAAVTGLIVSKMVPHFRRMQRRIDVINDVMREQITGIRVIRAFVREDYEEKRFAKANFKLFDSSLNAGKLMALMFPSVMTVMNLSTVAVMWFGGVRIDSGGMQIGSLTAFISYIMYILMAVMMSTMIFMMIPRAAVAADRVSEVLGTETTVVESPTPQSYPGGQATGRIEFTDVEFRYPGAEAPVLHDLSFTAEPGQTTAFIGSTGSGKTTLINLIPRLFDVTGGQVSIDGINIRDLALQYLWSTQALVSQKPYLFTGTIASNLRYGNDHASDEDLIEALRIAQSWDFVSALELGLEAPVAQGGTNFSGGQRQRLAIARALVRKAPILMFDDSFSALDYATDAALRAELAKNTKGQAVLVVAQRVSTIRGADKIIVLEHGRIVGQGTHESLLETCETYKEIVLSQITAQEAA